MINQAENLFQANNFAAAKAIYEKLTRQLPANLDVINNLALINANTGDFKTAKKLFEKSILINKGQPQVIENLINTLLDLKDYSHAIKLCEESIKIDPKNAITLFNKARALSGLTKTSEALKTYEVVLKIDPSYFLAHQNIGYILNRLSKYEKAIKHYNNAIELNPKNAVAFYNRGIAQGNLSLFEEATQSYKIAIEIDISFLPAYLNMGLALEKLGKYKQALNIYDQAQAIYPNNTEIYLNRGGLYSNLNNYDKASFDLKKIKEINPKQNNGNYNIALLNLKFRKFENTWDLYNLRWQIKQTYLNTKKPELKELPSTFKKLFVWTEQGIGDQIFFSNIIHNLVPFFESIIISIDPRMLTLYQRSFLQYGNCKIISSKDTIDGSDYDVQIPLGSIGKFFIKNKIDINSNVKPFLKSDPDQTKLIRSNLKKGGGTICGLSWKTKSKETGFNRSINLETLLPILQLDNFIFVNLQYGDCNEELKKLEKNHNIKIKDYDSIDNFNDLDSFVSLIEACDTVISIDTSCIHFAGALNKNAYLLLPHAIGTNWNWGTDQIKSEWYPSMRIIRQENPNDWSSVISSLKKELT